MVNGDHATSEEAAAEAEAEEEKSSSSSKESKFEMEEFGIKGASKCGKGGKGKGKKTLIPRVPIEASPAIQAKTDSKAPKTESKLAKVRGKGGAGRLKRGPGCVKGGPRWGEWWPIRHWVDG